MNPKLSETGSHPTKFSPFLFSHKAGRLAGSQKTLLGQNVVTCMIRGPTEKSYCVLPTTFFGLFIYFLRFNLHEIL